MVVMQHLGNVSALGVYAVFGFYILSGYLMTLILHSGYGYSWSGVRRFALNRFLRIYPIYWVACLISAGLVLWLGAQFTTDSTIPSTCRTIFRRCFETVSSYSGGTRFPDFRPRPGLYLLNWFFMYLLASAYRAQKK